MDDTKVCRRCGTEKSAAEFTANAAHADGLADWCRQCSKDARQARRSAAPVIPVATAGATPAPVRRSKSDHIQPKDVLATWAAVTMAIRAGEVGPNLFFIGPSGCGKTESAKDLAARSGLGFTQVDVPSMVDPEGWFGTREVVVKDGAPMTVYNESAFIRSIQLPEVTVLDEFNRASDAVRQILLALWDGSRSVTNPLTGETVHRHPANVMIATANVGLAFTGTYAVDPAFLTRALTIPFAYLKESDETKVVRGRTGIDAETASLLVRFANETRERAENDEDFPPVSTRAILAAAGLIRYGLDRTTAVEAAILNAQPTDGGADSIKAQMDILWKAIKPIPVDADDVDPGYFPPEA